MKKGVHLGRSKGADRIAFFITHLTSTFRLLRVFFSQEIESFEVLSGLDGR